MTIIEALWVGIYGALFWVVEGGWGIVLWGWGLVGKYFGWVGVEGMSGSGCR